MPEKEDSRKPETQILNIDVNPLTENFLEQVRRGEANFPFELRMCLLYNNLLSYASSGFKRVMREFGRAVYLF